MDHKKSSTEPGVQHRSIQGEIGVRLVDPSLPVPNFFIVGAAKAGTTSLHAYLSQHPQVFMSEVKEPHYFSYFEVSAEFDNFVPVIRNRDAYQALFRGSEGFIAVGEASPSYLCDPDAAIRIRSSIPNAKIIISLRNPVERAFSHYLMDFHEGRETLPFKEALEADYSRSEKGWGISAQYIELGLYAEQVQSFFRSFGREKVLVVLFEELVRDTSAVMQEIARFLGVDPMGYPKSTFNEVHNPFEVSRGAFARTILRCRPIRIWSKQWIPQKLRTAVRNRFLFTHDRKPGLDEVTRQSLAKLYAPDLQRLERLLDRDLGILRSNW